MSAAAWDTMAGIFAVIKKLNGNLDDGQKVVDAFKGLIINGPRSRVVPHPAIRREIEHGPITLPTFWICRFFEFAGLRGQKKRLNVALGWDDDGGIVTRAPRIETPTTTSCVC
jgi:hypothetical protein